jgi:hypothetical protein
VRAVGRIVVCVEAAAEVSTAITTILSHGVPSTSAPSSPSVSPDSSLAIASAPANATAAVATRT